MTGWVIELNGKPAYSLVTEAIEYQEVCVGNYGNKTGLIHPNKNSTQEPKLTQKVRTIVIIGV